MILIQIHLESKKERKMVNSGDPYSYSFISLFLKKTVLVINFFAISAF